MTSRRPKKTRKRDPEGSSTDEDDDRLVYFCPSDGIDIEVVSFYVRGLMDKSADIRVGSAEKKNKETIEGFKIRSITAIDREDIRAMMEDTRAWYGEMRAKNERFYYHGSDTAARRLNLGRAKLTPAVPMPKTKPNAPIAGSLPVAARSMSQSHAQQQIAPMPITRASTEQIPTMPNTSKLLSGGISTSVRPLSAAPATSSINQTSYGQSSMPKPQGLGRQITQITQYTEMGSNQPTSSFTQYSQPYNTRQGSAPPPYQSDDTKTTGSGSSGGNQPSTSGTVGFSRYATAGPPGMPWQQPR